MPNASRLWAAVLCAFALPLAARAATPVLDGVWVLDPGQAPGFADKASGPPPLTAKAAALYGQRKDALAKGEADIDPTAQCMPMGFPRDMFAVFPMQVVSDPQKVSLIFPSSIRVRRVFLDRTTHSDEIDPQFNGDSIGHWEGDALVVDTTNFLPDLWLDGTGAPQGPKTHVVERLSLAEGGRKLVDRITVDDPDLFTRPWTTTKTFSRRGDEVLTDALCEELSVKDKGWARRAR